MKALVVFACIASLVASSLGQDTFSWRYYRPGNTGIQGDICETLWVAPDGNPWIGGYDAGFEEGGIAKFIQSENRWQNLSNVDYPVIGHPENTGTARISDIDIDANGNMWMATGTGGLFYNPSAGPSSLRRFGADNSLIPGGWNRGVEVAPDGTVWFSSYSTVWGSGGIARYTPATNQWLVFESYGGGPLAIQPKPGSGYYVWTMLGPEVARFDSSTSTWTVLPKVNDNPSHLIGNNLTDSAGNTWMYKWTDATMNEIRLDLRRPNGTWANVPHAPFDVPFNSAQGLRAIAPNQALVVDGGGTAYRFDGTSWISLGWWQNTSWNYDIDQDASGNVWVCGIGGAARRDAGSGVWQRYRITNTSQFDSFNNDLTLGADGTMYATANAGPGYGGMVKYDGQRWVGFNNHHYGLGIDWPFPTDNSERVYKRPSNGELVVNPMFNGLHRFDGTSWSNLNVGTSSVDDMVEDSLGRLWVTFYGNLKFLSGNGWVQVANDILGDKLRSDPSRPGTVVAMGWTSIIRTDGLTTRTWTIEDFPMLDPQSDQFKGIAVAENGILWIGAYTVNLPDNSVIIKLNMNTGAYTTYRESQGWPFPGEYAMPLAATPDGKVWMQYDSDYLVAQRGMFWFDGTNIGVFPAPSGGEPQWGGLPHAAIYDLEVRPITSGYELWMSCASRGIAVLKVINAQQTPAITTIAPTNVVANQGNFTLTVNGSNFVSGTSTVRWNGVAQPTTFVSTTQLTATIANSTNQTIAFVPITVANGTLVSNAVNLQVRGTVSPASFAVLKGGIVAGGLFELQASDDLRLRVRPDFTGARLDPNIVIEGAFPAPVAAPSELHFKAEVNATQGPNVLKVQGFDYVSNVWVDLVTTTTSMIDTTYVHAITSNASRYASGGQMKMRVWVRALGSNGSRGWETQVDRMFIEVHP
ncbi:MAG: IPT/TIG domain-containing protein [Methanoregulaceae archaeon]|nr:IPT/TIG domain-containing protein [Methanoregulaceae archaeon]